MVFVIFLQALTAFLVSHLSNNLTANKLFDIKGYGRITYNKPPPPPQVYFPTSADYAEEYYLRSLYNITVTLPAPGFATDTDSTANTGTPFLGLSSLPGLFNRILHGLVPVVSRILSTAAEIIVAVLQALVAMGPPATAAYALHEQRNRDRDNLKLKGLSLQYRKKDWNTRQRGPHGKKKGSSTAKRIFDAQQEDSLAKCARYEVQIAEYEEEIQATIAEADERVKKAQEKFDGDLKTAREHIENLMSTIRSNSQELQMYRDRARAQRQAGPSGYPNHPPPMPFPHAPQFQQGQSPFAPGLTQNPGYPPNRTSGFLGNTLPPGWGRGAGAR
ncbi:hypothetical protein MMC22_004218 [Lobaria immixta]|nr:hypothetical protein [Lobaria immixta]